MLFKTSMQRHAETIHRLLPLFDASAQMDFANLHVRVSGRGRYFEMRPQYFGFVDGKRAYIPNLTKDVFGFIGWLPYFNKRWPTGSGKTAFKEMCVVDGLLTPATWPTPVAANADFLIKPRNGSFGDGIRGPFKPGDVRLASTPYSADSDYCEAFVRGKIAKIWYWDNRPACVEIQDMPEVVGDGDSTVETLVRRARSQFQSPAPGDAEMIASVCAFQGKSMDSVPRHDERVLVDFRYGTALAPFVRANTNSNRLDEISGSLVWRQIVDAGDILWNSIPESMRMACMYAVDVVIDGSDKVWFLEMNCNPVVHPDVYRLMFEGFLGPVEDPAFANSTTTDTPPLVLEPMQRMH